ncbi:hypothetical protein [Virgisporangium ochraceum]|uniref:Proteophosphoglycan 5 n=1 Tax=Virgisporangium ochraceum TaxID=65505 RepID=A0A8J3ZLW5_9ACTN|nr:hypothetical protein [Virgisporangium ochraceum]GIJ66709.1 hypothetical protein Voc01_016260 [Virgisporangium ochraceum]
MDPVDLDPFPVVWERWSVLAAVDAAATRGEDHNPDGASGTYYFPDVVGLGSYDHGGSWAQLVPVDDGRAVLFGYDRDYTRPEPTAGDAAPEWARAVVDDPRVWEETKYHLHRDRQAPRYLYWYDGASWFRERADGDDGRIDEVFDAEQTPLVLHDLLTQDLEYDPADDDEDDEVRAAIGRLVDAAHARRVDAAAVAAFLGRADVDVAPAVAMARRLGIAAAP